MANSPKKLDSFKDIFENPNNTPADRMNELITVIKELKEKENLTPEELKFIEKFEAIINQTQIGSKEISDEIEFTGGNLEEIGISRKIASNLGSEVLVISSPLNLIDFKDKIKAYQKEHSILVSGKIDAETYIEMKSTKVSEGIDKAIRNNELTDGLKSNILFLVENPKGGDDYLLCMAKLELIRTEFGTTEKSFIDEIEKKSKKGTIKAQNDPRIVKAGNTLGDGINNVINGIDTPEQFFKKNKGTMLVVGLIGFLFFGDKMTGGKLGTGSFWGRLLWLAGGGALGLHKVVGNLAEKGMDGISGLPDSSPIKKIQESISKGHGIRFEKGKNGVNDFFKTTIPETYDKISRAIGIKFDNITSNISSYNNSLKDSEDESLKKLFIPTEKLGVLKGDLLGDETFLNISKIDLQTISTRETLKPYITDETNKALDEAGIKDEEISTFIKKHLLEKSFDEGDEKVSDIFLTSEIKDKINSAIIDTTDSIIEGNSKLDEDIKKDLSGLINSTDARLKNVGIKLAKSLLNGELDDFKLENFPSIKGTSKTRIEGLIKKFENILAGEEHIQEKIDEVNKIELKTDGEFHETKENLEEKLEVLGLIMLDSTKLQTYDFSVDKFEDAKKSKEEEIFKAAEKLGFATLTVGGTIIEVNTRVEKLSKTSDVISDKKVLDDLEIPRIPNQNDNPLEFKKYWNDNKDKFEQVDKLLAKYFSATVGTPEKKVQLKAEEILTKKASFKINYEVIKTDYIIKLEPIIKEISSIDFNNYEDSKKLLKSKREELAEISGEIVEGFILNNVIDFVKRQIGEYIPNKSDNSFEYLDKELSSATSRPNLELVALTIRNKTIELENKLDTNIKIVLKFGVTSSAGTEIFNSNIGEFVKEVKSKLAIINSFDNDGTKEIKEKQLKKEISKAVTTYVIKIQGVNNLLLLEQIKSDYDDNIKAEFGGTVFGFIGNVIDEKDRKRVETAYEKKSEELNPKSQQTMKTNPELIDKYTNWGVVEFFNKHNNIGVIKNLDNKMGENTKLIDFKKSLITVKNMYKKDKSKKELIKDLDAILDKINTYINK